MGRLVLATAAPGAADGLAQAAAVAVAAADRGAGTALLVSLEAEPRRPGPTLLAAPEARELERALRGAGWEAAVARGHTCRLALPAEPESLAALGELARIAGAADAIAVVPASLWSEALAAQPSPAGGLLRARLPRDRSLAALVVSELRDRGLRARVAARPLGRVAGRRALAGIDPGGAASARAARLARGLLGNRGQAMPLALGGVAVLLTAATVLVAVGGAVTGKARAQRGADLAAVSAVRSLRDDAPRLLAPALLPGGAPNPRHLSKPAVLARAGAAARESARGNGISAAVVEVGFPDRHEPVPVQAEVKVRGEVEAEPGAAAATPIPVVAEATAEASPPAGWTGMPAEASGGGYSGPLAYRQGESMRPDVAEAFDRMAAAARDAGITLTITSGFRSDAEQAALFAAHPDPTWVAPPGQSLHRCGTELDLGPDGAYGWLAAKAPNFGFLKRYSWEAWHFGFVRGPAPCSRAGNSVSGAGPPGDGLGSGQGLPAFVPAQYRDAIGRAAGRWNVSAALLAAQIEAESGFNPNAVSPAGAQGISQFMPGTAASYGLKDPFDPEASIDAQAEMMSGLLRDFGSIPLALAAYNAGSGAVSACDCIPYSETRAYVARILALLGGGGGLGPPPLEVRLID